MTALMPVVGAAHRRPRDPRVRRWIAILALPALLTGAGIAWACDTVAAASTHVDGYIATTPITTAAAAPAPVVVATTVPAPAPAVHRTAVAHAVTPAAPAPVLGPPAVYTPPTTTAAPPTSTAAPTSTDAPSTSTDAPSSATPTPTATPGSAHHHSTT